MSRDEARGRLDARGERMPAAEDLGARGISLPSGADLERNQVARVVRALGEALDG